MWTNETLFPVANTTDIDALKALCDAEPACVGFNSHGWLKNGSTSVASNPVDLYLASDAPAPSTPLVWPRPASISVGASSLVVSPLLAFDATTSSPDLSAAFARTLALIFSNGPSNLSSAALSKAYPVLESVTVTVDDVSIPLQLGVNETYTLTLPAAGGAGVITAATVFGAYAALQTLSQLVAFDFDASVYWTAAPVAIKDGPRFPWRGLMVDPARHFLPPAMLRATVDAMTYAKLNTLHVHIVDCDSWPLQARLGRGRGLLPIGATCIRRERAGASPAQAVDGRVLPARALLHCGAYGAEGVAVVAVGAASFTSQRLGLVTAVPCPRATAGPRRVRASARRARRF